MRVPVIDGPSVLPDSRYRVTAPMQRDPDFSTARALGEFAQDVNRTARVVGDELAREQQARLTAEAKANREAQALVDSEAMLAFGKGADARLGAFKQVKGTQASATEADVIDDLDAWRQETAQSISDPAARQRFLVRSADPLAAYRKQISQHTYSEFEAARGDAVKAAKSSLLSKAESGQLSPDEMAVLARDAERTIRENQTSEAAGTAELEDFRSAAQSTYIDGLLSRGDVEAAQSLVENPEVQKRLGTRAAETTTRVRTAGEGRKRDVHDAGVAGMVDRAAERAKDKSGFMTEAALFSTLSPDGRALPKDVVAAAREKARVEKERFETVREEHRNVVWNAQRDKKPIPGGTVEFLREYDSKTLAAYDRRQEALQRRALSKSPKSTAAKQRSDDAAFLSYLRAELAENPDTDWREAEDAWAERQGGDVAVSDKARDDARRLATERANKADSDEGRAESKLAARVRGMLMVSMRAGLKRGEKIDGDKLTAAVGVILETHAELMARNNGKPLDEVALANLVVEHSQWMKSSQWQRPPIEGPASPPASQLPPRATTETKTVGGKTFKRVNGKWVQQ